MNFRQYNNVTSVTIPDRVKVTQPISIFQSMKNLVTATLPNNVNSLSCSYLFCSNFAGPPMCGDNVTDMYFTYGSCTNMKGSPVCGPKVTNMVWSYTGCSSITGDAACGDNVTNMYQAYLNCTNLSGNAACGENVVNMSQTYMNCYNLAGSPACGSNVTDMSMAYHSCYNLTGSPICGENVTDMSMSYYSCDKLTGSPVCGPNVVTMSYAYTGCGNLTGTPVCGPNVTDMSGAYFDCGHFIRPVIGSSVRNARSAYSGCTFSADCVLINHLPEDYLGMLENTDITPCIISTNTGDALDIVATLLNKPTEWEIIALDTDTYANSYHCVSIDGYKDCYIFPSEGMYDLYKAKNPSMTFVDLVE